MLSKKCSIFQLLSNSAVYFFSNISRVARVAENTLKGTVGYYIVACEWGRNKYEYYNVYWRAHLC